MSDSDYLSKMTLLHTADIRHQYAADFFDVLNRHWEGAEVRNRARVISEICYFAHIPEVDVLRIVQILEKGSAR